MPPSVALHLAILFPGDREARSRVTAANNRFADLFSAFAAAGLEAEPAVYHDDFAAEVRQQLMRCQGVLVWVNPIEAERSRHVLDSLLREVADAGIFVSTHPDVILKLGTKEVLVTTRDVGWGCDTHQYVSLEQMRRELPGRLAAGQARVLKQNRGSGGNGVWRVQLRDGPTSAAPGMETIIRARHAKRGCVEEEVTLGDFCERCAEYFQPVDGRMIDQEYQARLPEGMIRCYLVHDEVVGFGHQSVNALFPSAGAQEAPQPGPRYYHPPSQPEFQVLKSRLEKQWVPAVQKRLDIARQSLPILWDCDFLLGAKNASGKDAYVLCEINVSSVAPYPPSAVPCVVEATRACMRAFAAAKGTGSFAGLRADEAADQFEL